MAVISLVTAAANATLLERLEAIEKSSLRKFFKFAAATDTDKDKAFDETVEKLCLPRDQILITDDRTVRGIRYANQNGHPSIWVCRGKFAHELPNKETGNPTHTVRSLKEIVSLI